MADGGPPEELVEVRMLERFHWTYDQLDAADIARLFPGVTAANITDSLRSVQRWMDAAGRGFKIAMPSEQELAIWGDVTKAMQEAEQRN